MMINSKLIKLLLFSILLLPIIFSLWRKLLPAQPAIIESISVIVFLFFGFFALFGCNYKNFGVYPFLLFIFLFFMALPSLFSESIYFFIAVFVSMVLPIFIIGILNNRYRYDELIKLRFNPFVIFILIINISGIVQIFIELLGAPLPSIFLPIQSQLDEMKGSRLGVIAHSGLYSTNSYYSYALILACFVLLYLKSESKISAKSYFLSLTIILICVFFSAKRAAFFLILFIFAINFLASGRGYGSSKVIKVVFLFSFVLLISVFGIEFFFGERSVLLQEGGLDLKFRINEVFFGYVLFWYDQSFFGNFLGYTSGVSKLFNVRDLLIPTEVGMAALIADMGVPFALVYILFIFVVFLDSLNYAISNKKSLIYFPLFSIVFFSLYLFKENGAISGGGIWYVVFWFFLFFPRIFVRGSF